MSDKNKTMATDGTIDCFAKLNNVPTSPRKMRLVVDNIRGMEVTRALGILRFSSRKASATRLLKLLQSAIANWEQVNGRKTEEESFISLAFLSMEVQRLNVFVRLLRGAATAFVSAATM